MTKSSKHAGRKIKPAASPTRTFDLTRGNTVTHTGSANESPGRVTTDNPNLDQIPGAAKLESPPLAPSPDTQALQSGLPIVAIAPETDRDADHGANDGEFSPGKNLVAVDWKAPIARYVNDISENWRRGVEALLEIGRLCAEAEDRLDPAQQAELKAKLPFGAATFSKFRQIGLDARLRKPEVQLLLPAAYTTIYAITRLNDDDLNDAITENVINPDVKREKVEKWWKEREATRQQKADTPDDAAASPADPVSDAVDNNVTGVAEPSVPGEAPVPTVEAPQPLASSEVMPGADNSTSASPSVTPQDDENLPSVSDVHLLSPNDQQAFNDLVHAWHSASKGVQERFVSEVLGLDPSSISGRTPTGGEP